MENQLLELIKTCRSCRHYKAEQVSDELLNAVLEAGEYAVQNDDIKAQLARLNAQIMGVDSNPYYDAPTYLLVFSTKDNPNAFQDGSCVLENMMLAAHAVGLATCWINREYQMFQTEEGKLLMKTLGVDEQYIGIGALSLGYASREARPAAPRKEGRIRVVK